MSRAERKVLLDRVVDENSKDGKTLRQAVKDRLDRAGLARPRVEVRWEDLAVEARVLFGQRARPTVLSFYRDALLAPLVAAGLVRDARVRLRILERCSGRLEPGRLTLLLGAPASGKSTLLHALAGALHGGALKVRGRVTYNGRALGEFQARRTAALVEQRDMHVAQLTVRETLDFAARCQGSGSRAAEVREARRREKAAGIEVDWAVDAFMKAQALPGRRESLATDLQLRLLDLECCQDTAVGGGWFRGVSGGQVKRTSAGEVLVGPQRVYFLDEVTTGLDSATAHQVVSVLRDLAHLESATVLAALQQPAPETFALFDDVMLISEGLVLFHGPRADALPFFERLGFACPPRKDPAGFLQEVTSARDQAQFWAGKGEWQHMPVRDIAAAWRRSSSGLAAAAALAAPLRPSRDGDAALAWAPYALRGWRAFKACLQREWVLTERYSFLYKFRTAQVAIMAIITGTMFLRTRIEPDSVLNGSMYMSVCFYSVMIMMFNGLTEMTIAVDRLPVFYKQRDMRLYPAWAYTLPTTFLRVFYSATEAGVWSLIVYWAVGFTPEVSRFLSFYLILFLVHCNALAMFRMFAALTRDMVVANSLGSCFLVVFLMLSGYIFAQTDMPRGWAWATWVDPLAYAVQALIANEFAAKRWSVPYEFADPGSTTTLGEAALDVRGFRRGQRWVGIGCAAQLACILLFNALTVVFNRYMQPFERPVSVLSKEGLAEREAARAGRPSPSAQRAGGLALPFRPLTLAFRDIAYSVELPKGVEVDLLADPDNPTHARAAAPAAGGNGGLGAKRQRLEILRGVTGTFRPGVLTALVGVSGAGKTTLMDVLAGRKTTGRISGDIRVNSFPWERRTFARISGYVEQTDVNAPKATVWEALAFSAALRLPPSVTPRERADFVEQVLHLVELAPLRDLLVGVPGGTGLSLEQRKRLTIAVELVANPAIIFLDEPTTGLDARAAAVVMRAIRNIVDTGRTVVTTIHQPSIDIFEAFDELLLLKRGGRPIYCGPLGASSADMAIPGVPALPEQSHAADGGDAEGGGGGKRARPAANPATWVLDISRPSAEQRLGIDFAEVYAASSMARSVAAAVEAQMYPRPGAAPLAFPGRYAASLGVQLRELAARAARTWWRTPDYNATRFLITLGIALIFGSMYWKRAHVRYVPADVMNIEGALYFCTFFMGVVNSIVVQPVFAGERAVCYRERAAGMYAVLPFSLSLAGVELLYNAVQALLYTLIVFYMVGFNMDGSSTVKFWWFLTFMYGTLMYCTMFGLMVIAISPNLMIAAVISAAFYSMWNLFAGFILPRPRMPGWWEWYSNVNPVAWSVYGLVASQLGDDYTYYVNTYGLDVSTGKYGEDMWVAVFVQRYYGYDYTQLPRVAPIVFGFAAAFWAIATVALRFTNFQKR
ncbi:hypothetical protein WJX81_008449 [Elliptochloris bilobata]|uniref:ABC transporter domain-containing protein n=1 Tax=Elliptochloris bilobata TaxID=381761 RepID=A0AAW1RRV2_9CHLO